MDKVAVIDWKDLDQDILSKWFELYPFVIKNSNVSQWKLTRYLQQNNINIGNQKIISYFDTKQFKENIDEIDKRFSFIKSQSKSTNCCFTNSYEFCKKFVSSFIYSSIDNKG